MTKEILWRGKGEAHKSLTIHEEDGKFIGTRTENLIPYASDRVEVLSGNSLSDAILEINRLDADLYWFATAYSEEG